VQNQAASALICTRCQGFVMTDQYETRCLNCGARPFEVRRNLEPPKQGRRRRCGNCHEPAIAGHHYCQMHLDYFKAYKMKRLQ